MTDSSDALAGVPATSYLSPRVRQYADHAKAANTRMAYRIDWDGRTDAGATVSSGVYFARIVHNGVARSKKMVMLK